MIERTDALVVHPQANVVAKRDDMLFTELISVDPGRQCDIGGIPEVGGDSD